MENIKIENFGPIESADIQFGDLTLLVGPQASGKSIMLQLLKLIVDKMHIRKTVEQYGLVWGHHSKAVLERYFGEGMAAIWNDKTSIYFDGKLWKKSELEPKRGEKIGNPTETLFYIPAQRVVCLNYGWPRFFTEYEDSVPYVLRQFSETLRLLLENGGKEDAIFPRSQSLKAPLRTAFNDSIFHNGKIVVDQVAKKRLKLQLSDSTIPFMAWSAGQKEFMPLLLSFYWLCPSSKVSLRDDVRYVILEEPEMGLHPQAIKAVILQMIDLISRGYKLIVSTHSPVFLEFAWAFNAIRDGKDFNKNMHELFEVKKTAITSKLFADLQKKRLQTYFFKRELEKVNVVDISSLDAGDDNASISEWGGLSSFISKATDIVVTAANHEA